MPNIMILALALFLDILLTRLFILSEKGAQHQKDRPADEKKIRVSLFFMYIPHIKFQDSSIRGS